jgi:hypothetical protein
MLHALVFPAEALVVLYWAKDLGAEKAILFGFECPIVDGLGLFNLTM